MTKYNVKKLWNERYGNTDEVVDYAGNVMKKSACGNTNSNFEPTIDHIRPLACGGKDSKENIVLCNYRTNEQKADKFPHWQVDENRYHAQKVKGKSGVYEIIKER